MARDYVKDLDAVKKFNAELDKSYDMLDSLKGVGKDLTVSLLKVADATEKSKKYKKENLDIAKQETKVGKRIINVLNQQNKGSKLGTVMAKARLKLSRVFADKSKGITGTLLKQYDLQQKSLKTEKKLSMAKDKAAEKQKILDKLTGGMSSKAKGMLGHVKKVGPGFAAAGLAAGLIVGTVGLISKAVRFTSSMLDKAGEKFGVMGARGGDFSRQLQDSGVNVMGIGKNLDDVLSVTDSLTKNFGFTMGAALDISEKALDTGVALGVSTDEAANLYGIFMGIGGLSAELAEDLIEDTYQLAQQSKVNPSAVMKDIAGSAETIAKFGAQNLESITKAAVQARQMGINLDAVAGAAEGLLDFQGSITKELQAEMLIGRDLELGRARQFALAGDLNGVMKEIVKNVGSENRYNRMNVIQRRSLAAAVGMTVMQLDKLVRNQDKSVQQTKTFTDLLGKDGMSALTSLINKIKQMGANLLKSLGRPMEQIFEKIEGFLLDPNLQANFENFTAKFEEKVDKFVGSIVDIPDQIALVSETVKGAAKTAGYTGGGAALGAAIGSVVPGLGTAIGAVIGGGLGYMLSDFQSKNTGSHLIVTPSGNMVRTHPQDTIVGSTKIRNVNDFTSGPAGSNPLGTDMSETNALLKELIRAFNDKTDVNTRTTDALANRIVTGIGNL